MKRYNLLDGESYGKRYQMVEEKDGDWVWWEDVQAILEDYKLNNIDCKPINYCEDQNGRLTT